MRGNTEIPRHWVTEASVLKPFLFRLANKQDKMNALLGNELIEILSLEKLVNQSRSLCHIVSVALKFTNAN